MQYKKYNNTVVLRLDAGDEVLSALKQVASAEQIKTAKVSGIGATNNLLVGVFDTSKGTYQEFLYTCNMEINNLCGNITTKDGLPYAHLHITCTNGEGKVVGGHLLSAKISLTAEIFIEIVNGTVTRTFNNKLGINCMDFSD